VPGSNRNTLAVPATPWGLGWLLHVNDAQGMADLNFSAYMQTLPPAATATALGVLTKWPVKHTSDYAHDLDAMIAALGAGPYIVHVDANCVCSANTACGDGIQFIFEPGAVITINNGVTLTIYSPEHVQCPARQQAWACVGTGAVAFTNVGEAWAHWWGAVGNGAANDTAALQAAIVQGGHYGTVHLAAGTYLFSQLVFDNPLIFGGAGEAVRNRWNTYASNVTLLSSGASDPAIMIGGSAASIVVETGFEFVEGLRLKNFLLRPNAGAGRGMLIDGSTTLRGTRGPVRDLVFSNVHVTGYTDHNVEFLGNCFDVRFHGGSSRLCGTTGMIHTTAASHGLTTPDQVYLYDFYAWGNDIGPQWALDGRFKMFGGGLAYGSGFIMRSGACIFGTHVEGSSIAGGIGLQLIGSYQRIALSNLATYQTGIKVGDGTAGATRYYSIDAMILGATTGIEITNGGDRTGTARLRFETCTTDIVDTRSSGGGVHNSLRWLDKPVAGLPPAAGNHVRGQEVLCDDPMAGTAVAWRCSATGAPGNWIATGTRPGAIGKTADYPVVVGDIGKRFSNASAGAMITFTLLDSTVGMMFGFIRIAAQIVRIDPDASDSIRGGTGAGKYMQLDNVGDAVTLMCVAAGVWEIIEKNCTPTFE